MVLSQFQSTLPTRGSDGTLPQRLHLQRRFQSTLPTRGSDAAFSAAAFSDKNFNPRSPRGGATISTKILFLQLPFQSTLPTRGSDEEIAELEQLAAISIHAPHEGERQADLAHDARRKCISIHAPHEGERLDLRGLKVAEYKFQSTLPTRGSDDYAHGAV